MKTCRLTLEEIQRCNEFAKARTEQNVHAKNNPRFNFENDKLARLISVRGELGFAKISGLPMDWSLSPRRGGPDFVAGKVTIDVKTAIRMESGRLSVQPWKKDPPYRCDAYVHCRLVPGSREAGIMRELTTRDLDTVWIEGFAWDYEVFTPARFLPANPERKTTDHYSIPVDALNDLAELLAYIEQPVL